MNTLGLCKASSAINRVAGLCPTSQDFTDLLNDAVRMLMARGDWYGTVQKVSACVYNACVTWPRGVLLPLAINPCNGPTTPMNHWYQFDYVTRGDLMDYWSLGFCGRVRGMDGENSPVFNPISCNYSTAGVYIRFYPTQQSDIGKTITVFGIDSNGRELRSQYPDGTWQAGVIVPLAMNADGYCTLTALAPNVSTLRHITKVIKEVTDGPVYAYQYDAVNDVLLDLAYYEASETNPSYRTTHLPAYPGLCCTADKAHKISALVKLEFIPVVNDNDTVQIENVDAIASMMQAIKMRDAYDPDEKRKAEAEAVRELNLQLRTQLPLDQIPIQVSPFGTAIPSRHTIGRMI